MVKMLQTSRVPEFNEPFADMEKKVHKELDIPRMDADGIIVYRKAVMFCSSHHFQSFALEQSSF